MSQRLDEMDYYTLLGVPADASVDAIKLGFRAFARRFHPDRFAGHPDEHVAQAATIYRRATEAYRVLTNAEQRRYYDEQRAQGYVRFDPTRVRRSARPSGAPGHGETYAAKARPFVAQAEQALRAKNYKQAKLNLQIALQHDPNNESLRQKLAEVSSLVPSRAPAAPSPENEEIP